MKKVLAAILCAALITSMSGCSNIESEQLQSQEITSKSSITESAVTNKSDYSEASNSHDYDKEELKNQAYEILNSLSDDDRIKDYMTAVDILDNLPSDKENFLIKLKEVQRITDKYGIELHNVDYLLTPHNSLEHSNDDLYEYISSDSSSRRSDIWDLTEQLVFPAVFDVYGNDAQHIKNIDIDMVHRCFANSGYTELTDQKETNYTITEIWKQPYTNGNGAMEVSYYPNGLVESIKFPLTFADEQFDDTELMSIFNLSLEEQKALEGPRFEIMAQGFTEYIYGKEILDTVFSKEELNIIKTFITSLNEEIIWEKDFFGYFERFSWLNASLSSRLSGTRISIKFNTNEINLELSGTNFYNDVTYNYYTIFCGILSNFEDIYSDYHDYLIDDDSRNDKLLDWDIDLIDYFATNNISYDASKPVESKEDNETNIITESNNIDSQSYYYDEGCVYLKNKQYLKAIDCFEHNLDYLDSEDKYKEANYLYGEELLNNGNPTEAAGYFLNAGDYKDSSTRIQRYHYEKAETLLKNKDYLSASEEYLLAGAYSDSNTKILECYYQYGVQQLDQNNLSNAKTYLSKCKGYKDSDEKLLPYYYSDASKAVDKMLKTFSQYSFTQEVKDAYATAKEKLLLCGNYNDSKMLLKIVDKLYYAWDTTPSVTNHEASLSNMTVNYSGSVVKIYREKFVSGTSCNLTLSYNAEDNTFEADITNMFNDSVRQSDARNVITGLIKLFTSIDDLSDFDTALSDKNNWTIADSSELFTIKYGGYSIKIKTTSSRNHYIDCNISVSK